MRIHTNPDRVYAHIHAASRRSAEGTLALIQRKLRSRSVHPYATGKLAASYRLEILEESPDGILAAFTSDSPYAVPIEWGAWSFGARGPYISGSGNVARGGGYTGKGRKEVKNTARRDWPRRIAKELRAL